MIMRFIGIIPARYASSRFPGKPLAVIDGKTMIQRVAEQCQKCKMLDEVVVATDDQRIFDHVSIFGKAVMTRSDHPSGTDRCLEALDIINKNKKYQDSDCLINIQGDEPFISPTQIETIANELKDTGKNIISLVKKLDNEAAHANPNIVKVVFTNSFKALYFSRAPIPYFKQLSRKEKCQQNFGYKHIGLYGFRIGTLRQVTKANKTALEEIEALEQLRWLQHGFDVFLAETHLESMAVDTPGDLENLTQSLKADK